MSWYKPSDVGFATRSKLAGLGYGARLFFRLLATIGPAFRRFGLIRDQIHFLGNYSLVIIAVSGLFVALCLVCRGITRCCVLVLPMPWVSWSPSPWCVSWAPW